MTAPSSDVHQRLLELSEQACNGTLGAEDYIQLDAMLSASHRNQLVYLEYLHLYSELETLAKGEDRPAVKVLERRRGAGLTKAVLVGLSVCLSWGLVLWGMSYLATKKPAARQEIVKSKEVPPLWLARVHRFSGNAAWKVDGHDKGSHVFQRQSLVIRDGCLELDFRNGTKLSAEGPTELVIHDDLRVSLVRGTVRATLADGVSGFRVETGTMEIVDRGTQFYVQLDKDGVTTSYVSDGVCDIRDRGGNTSMTPYRKLVAGECALVDHDQKLVLLSSEQSRKFSEQMVSAFLSYDMQIERTSPSVCVISPPEGMLDHLFSSANRPVYLIPEQRNVVLQEDLVLPGGSGEKPVLLRAGTSVDSFLVHSAFGPDLPAGASGKLLRETRTAGEIVFEHEILAVLSDHEHLVQTDGAFAASGVRFPAQGSRALEGRDRLSVSPTDPGRVDFEFRATEGDVDHVRILVRSAAGKPH